MAFLTSSRKEGSLSPLCGTEVGDGGAVIPELVSGGEQVNTKGRLGGGIAPHDGPECGFS